MEGLLPERPGNIRLKAERSRRLTQIAIFHRRMANHTGSLRVVSFLGNQSVCQPVHRPRHYFVAINGSVVETYFLEVDRIHQMQPQLIAPRSMMPRLSSASAH